VRIAATLRRARALPWAMLLIVVLHLSYGTGVPRGVLRPSPAVDEPELVPAPAPAAGTPADAAAATAEVAPVAATAVSPADA
jgi:hypothetical protein